MLLVDVKWVGFVVDSGPHQMDVAMKIMSFAQHCSRAVCILSTTGSVSTLSSRVFELWKHCYLREMFRHPLFIGSLLLTDNTGSRNRIGGLSISPASPDGCVLGGVVGDYSLLRRLFSFSWGYSKSKKKKREGPMATDSCGLVIQRLNPTSNSPGQKRSTVPVGLWPDDSQPVDINDVRAINLMRR